MAFQIQFMHMLHVDSIESLNISPSITLRTIQFNLCLIEANGERWTVFVTGETKHMHKHKNQKYRILFIATVTLFSLWQRRKKNRSSKIGVCSASFSVYHTRIDIFSDRNNNNEAFLSFSFYLSCSSSSWQWTIIDPLFFNSIFTHELMNRIISLKLIDWIYGYWA